MKTINLQSEVECDHFAGKRMDESHYDQLVGGDEAVDIIKPDGTVLCKYRPNWFSNDLCNKVLPSCRKAAVANDMRGTAAGDLEVAEDIRQSIGKRKDNTYRARKRDGTISNTSRAASVYSGVIGYFDRSARFPFCRQTAFLIHQAAKWKQFLPYIRRADEGFKHYMQERWEAQKEFVTKTPSSYVIPESTFTTVTVNRNFQTAVHKDAGDLASGFGVMSCLRNDKYTGGYLCFPRYRVAVDMANGCLCLADVHEWHGNTTITRRIGYERITLVFYYRENMVKCLEPREEENWTKNRKRGTKIR